MPSEATADFSALNIPVNIFAVGAVEMIVSEDSSFSGVSWINVPASGLYDHTLSSSPGPKEVFIKFRDNALNESFLYSQSYPKNLRLYSLDDLSLVVRWDKYYDGAFFDNYTVTIQEKALVDDVDLYKEDLIIRKLMAV